jgi:hypothetical protein
VENTQDQKARQKRERETERSKKVNKKEIQYEVTHYRHSLCGFLVQMRGDVQRGVLLLLLNLVPHPVSFHINVLVFSKIEIAIILFFAAITIWSVILVSIYYINNVKCYNYRCC